MPDCQNRAGTPPSAWIMRYAAEIPDDGTILDLACGAGRHLAALCARGRTQPLLGIDLDISKAAQLEQRPNLTLLALDLEQPGARIPGGNYAGIIVSNYLHRPLLPRLPGLLAPGGILLYETFAVGNEAYGRPRNPDYLLRAGELLECFAADLDVLGFEQGYVDAPHPAVKQRFCGRRPL